MHQIIMPSDRHFSTCLCLLSASPEVKCWVELVFKMILITVNVEVATFWGLLSDCWVFWVGLGLGCVFLKGACVFSILS